MVDNGVRAEKAEADRDNWKSHAEERGELLKDLTEVNRLCNEQRPTYSELRQGNKRLREALEIKTSQHVDECDCYLCEALKKD
jgi:hypothetical protein